MKHGIKILSTLLILSSPASAGGPEWGVKTNLFYDATATFNAGVELRTGRRTSVGVEGNWNPWTFGNDRKWKHYLVQPEIRFWGKETFRGSFLGLHAHYAVYSVSNLPFASNLRDHRFEGWALGAGVSWGHRWNFDSRWAMEATVGVGYARLSYDKFECGGCGRLSTGTMNYFGPTKAGVALIYNIGRAKAPAPVAPPPVITEEPVVIPEPEVVVEPVVMPEPEPEAVVETRCEEGAALLDFGVGRSEILPALRNNAAELQKIHDIVRDVRNNRNATITAITITGYASPEGSYETNLSLSERRAQALEGHLRAVHGLREEIFTVYGAGEDWAGLDALVAGSDMADRYRVLEIIRGVDIFDGRETRLMQLAGGVPYRQMRATMFPRLRRVEYKIFYTITE